MSLLYPKSRIPDLIDWDMAWVLGFLSHISGPHGQGRLKAIPVGQHPKNILEWQHHNPLGTY